jgi:hypothetical protein
VAQLLEQQLQGHTVELTLCGERGWLRLQSITAGLLGRLAHRLVAPSWPALMREAL